MDNKIRVKINKRNVCQEIKDKALKLNLGSFSQCVEFLGDGQNAEFSLNPEQKVFYYMSQDGDIVSTELAQSSITIPTFDIGTAVDNGHIGDSDRLQRLLSSIELDIFTMIARILKESDNQYKWKFENIYIPICSVKAFDDDKHNSCYGWAHVGIAIIV